jgi:hypothetical protein
VDGQWTTAGPSSTLWRTLGCAASGRRGMTLSGGSPGERRSHWTTSVRAVVDWV